MAIIGTFSRISDGYRGRVHTLGLDAELVFVPVSNGGNDNAPDYRIHCDAPDGPEVGAGWSRTGEKAGAFVAVQLDGPTFVHPIRANLFQANDVPDAFNLVWNRPSRRDPES